MRPAGNVTGARTLRRRDLFPRPVIDGREARDHSLARLRRRMGSLLVSGAERDEAELERRLRALPGVTRPNVVAVASPKGGVGKTTCAFVAGNILASHLKLRAIAVDANPGFGTLGRFVADSAGAEVVARRFARPRRPSGDGRGASPLRGAAARAVSTSLPRRTT